MILALATEDVAGWIAIVTAIVAALITGMVSGIRQLRGAARDEDSADHAAWRERIREVEAVADELQGMLPTARAQKRRAISVLPDRVRLAMRPLDRVSNAPAAGPSKSTVPPSKLKNGCSNGWWPGSAWIRPPLPATSHSPSSASIR